jgi:hypothetical protein
MSGPARSAGNGVWQGPSFRRSLAYGVLVAIVLIPVIAMVTAYAPPISDGTLFAALLFGSLLGSYALSVWIVWTVNRRSPDGILDRLRRHGRHKVRVPAGRFTWNPALPRGSANRVFGPGWATYRLDDDGMVHLHFAPAEGSSEDWVGPRPEGTTDRPTSAVRGLVLVYPASALVGFLLGYFVVAHQAADRVRGGLWYALVGWFAAWCVLHVAQIVLRSRPGRDAQSGV